MIRLSGLRRRAEVRSSALIALLLAIAPSLRAQTPEDIADTVVFIYSAADQPCTAPAAGAGPPVALGTGFVVFLSAGKKNDQGSNVGLRLGVPFGDITPLKRASHSRSAERSPFQSRWPLCRSQRYCLEFPINRRC
jgi:hypothetical protein